MFNLTATREGHGDRYIGGYVDNHNSHRLTGIADQSVYRPRQLLGRPNDDFPHTHLYAVYAFRLSSVQFVVYYNYSSYGRLRPSV